MNVKGHENKSKRTKIGKTNRAPNKQCAYSFFVCAFPEQISRDQPSTGFLLCVPWKKYKSCTDKRWHLPSLRTLKKVGIRFSVEEQRIRNLYHTLERHYILIIQNFLAIPLDIHSIRFDTENWSGAAKSTRKCIPFYTRNLYRSRLIRFYSTKNTTHNN